MQQGTRAQLLACVSIIGLTLPAWGQEEPSAQEPYVLDGVVVTARFKAESTQDIGASVAAISDEDIERLGIRDFDDISRLVAGVQNVKSQQNANNIAIRGVVDSKPDALYSTSSLYSIFLDEVSVAAPGLQRDFSSVDLNRVEIIRGPQPTLFGEGAVGGVVRYFTNDPDLDGSTVTGYARGQVESITDGGIAYSGENATSLIFAPGKAGLRVSGFYRKDEGFIDNPAEGEDVNDFDSIGGRAVLLARPTDQLELRLSAFLMRDEMGESSQVDPGSDPEDLIFSASPLSGVYKDDFDLYSGRITYDAGPMSVTSITGYYERTNSESRFSASNTFGLAPFFASDTPGTTIDSTTFQTVDREQSQFSQELRFVSDFEGPLNFTGGLYYRDKDIEERATLDCAGCAPVTSPSSRFLLDQFTTTNSEQYSGFIEGTYSLTDRFRVIAGARYIDDTVSVKLVTNNVINLNPRFDGGGNIIFWTESDPLGFASPIDILVGAGFGDEFEFKLSKTLPRIGVEFDVNDDMLLYASAAEGTRNGGIGQAVAALTTSGGDPAVFYDNLSYDADEVVTLEGGIKATWLGGALTTNAGIFQTRFKDTQILVMLPASNVVNGPDQDIIGLEFETAYRFSDTLSGFLNATLLDTEFKGNYATTNTLPPGASSPFYDLKSGNEAPQAPSLSFSTGYTYARPLNDTWQITSSGVFQYVGERYSDVQNYRSSELDPLEILNLRLGLESDRWSASLFATNLLNDVEAVRVDANVLAQSVGPDGVLDSAPISVSVNRPRSFGLSLSLRY